MLLIYLYSHTALVGKTYCEHSLSDWARISGLSQQAIANAFNRLEKMRLVEIVRPGKRHIPLKYRLTLGNFMPQNARRGNARHALQSATHPGRTDETRPALPEKRFLTRSMLNAGDQAIFDSIAASLSQAESGGIMREARETWGQDATGIGYEDILIRRYFGPDRLEKYQ